MSPIVFGRNSEQAAVEQPHCEENVSTHTTSDDDRETLERLKVLFLSQGQTSGFEIVEETVSTKRIE